MDAPGRDGVQGQVAYLAALAVDFQVLDTAPFLDVADLQLRCFFAAQAVVKQNS